jgi:hypothetical protein
MSQAAAVNDLIGSPFPVRGISMSSNLFICFKLLSKSSEYFLRFFKSEELYQLFEKRLVDSRFIAVFHHNVIS